MTDDNAYWSRVRREILKPYFYCNHGCGAANYYSKINAGTYPLYLAGWYVFNRQPGTRSLVCMGSTDTWYGFIGYPVHIYSKLNDGSMLGTNWLHWWKSNISPRGSPYAWEPYEEYLKRKNDIMGGAVFIGDPALRS
jgi:hypothetical protein